MTEKKPSQPKLPIVINDTEWSDRVVRELNEYIEGCETQIDADLDKDDLFETITGEYFCGCSTCYEREQWIFMAAEILKGAAEGKIELT